MPGRREEWPCPSTRTPTPGVMKFIILVNPSLVISTIHLVCMDHAPDLEKKIFKEIHQFYTFYPKITSSWRGGGGMKFTIYCLLTLQMLHTKFGQDWLSSSCPNEKKMLTDDTPEWLRWPKMYRWNKVIKYLYSVYFLYLNFSEANFTGLMLPYM